MVPRVGQRIGPYEILGRLGSGGMGLVFSAWDARLHRDVAVKLLREEYATPTMRSRFLQEARAASGLNHPNICTIFDIGEVAGDPFLVMELLKGETLRQRILQKTKLSPEDVHRIGMEVLDALAMAHARGVIHRDIKPANIILVNRPGGGFQAKVLDFGLAKVELADEESTRYDLTTIGTTVGTVSYMSPEQARGETIDARSDMFSLGSVLYEAATGKLPFQGATSALIFVELLGKAPVGVRQHNPAVSKDLEKFILKLLAKSPADRYQSATEALQALRAVSLRRSTFGSLSLWSARSTPSKQPQTEAAAAPVAERAAAPSPGTSPDPLHTRSAGDTVLRPARRAPDPLAPRTANSPVPASPAPVVERTAATAEGLPYVTPATSSSTAENSPFPASRPESDRGAVVLRPVKPERSSLARDSHSAGSSAESNVSVPLRGPAFAGTVPAAMQADPRPPALISFGEANEGADRAMRSAEDEEHDFHPSPAPASSPEAPRLISDHRHLDERDETEGRSAPARGRRFWPLLGLAVVLLAGFFTRYLLIHRRPIETPPPTNIALGSVQNSTADGSLGPVFSAGLELAAAQSPRLSIRSHEMYVAGLHATGQSGGEGSLAGAQEAAKATGASVLAQGEIRSEGSTYQLLLRLFDVDSGQQLAEMSETASSREQIPDALDRLASDLRSSQGEGSDAIGRLSTPLSKEATSNLDALQSYASGLNLEAAGNTAQAILAFRRAISFEPHFTQAFLHIAELDRFREYAEVAADKAAADAEASAVNAGPRTQHIAQAVYATLVTRDYARASETLSQVLREYPDDSEAMTELARVQFLSGHFADAQDAAENVLRYSHLAPQATELEELTLIAQGRPEAVPAIEAQAQAAGLPHPDAAVLAAAASLSGTEMFVPPNVPGLSPVTQATLLDAAGLFEQGAELWTSAASEDMSSEETISAAAFAYASAALHHALAGDCAYALAQARRAQALPSGTLATFKAGEADALCGELEGAHRSLTNLTGQRGTGSSTPPYLVADLSATLLWKNGNPEAALRTLDAARQYDPMSLTAYLRGLVEIAAREPQLSIVQFQAILSHRGPATLFNPEIYPLSQLGLSQAYTASGDTANGTAAYERFREFWKTPANGSE